MRRARIKAVAALPVRRKNNEATKKEAASKPATTSEPETPNPAPTCESEAPKTSVTTPTGNDNISVTESPKPNEPNCTDSPVHTPRRSRIQTPNLIERSGTPKSKKPGTPQRLSSPHFSRNSTLTKLFSPISEAKAQIIGELSTDHRFKPSSVKPGAVSPISQARAQILSDLSTDDRIKPSPINTTSPLAALSKPRVVSPISQAKEQILSDLSTDDRIKQSSISIASPLATLSKPRPVSPISQAKAQILSDLSTEDRVKPSSINITSPLATVIKPRQKTQPKSPKSTEIHKANEIGGIVKIQPYYNPPSIPESVTDDTVLDGIVPLQANISQQSSAVPLALLKNEIISENAQVLFDPIVPLPSPSKVRPKLRPAPRLAFRRNSVQGSASESEDESRRALLSGATTPALPPRQRHESHTSHSTQYTLPNREVARVRNDSVCSVVSQATVQQQPPPSTPTLTKERHVSKARRTEMSRRMSALRRRQRGRDNVPRDALTMYDLIFYNPTGNPIIPDEPEKPKELPVEPKEKEAEKPTKEVEEAEEVDDPPESAPVPQIKLGPNGEIILDEKSLVIDQTEGPRKLSSSIVHENEWAHNSRGKYSRAPRTADWSDAETVRFYRALAALGTDFTLMESLFPGRTRRDLKLKFKREERSNGAQVDKALRSQIQWDALGLTREFASERRAAAEQAAQQKEALLEQKRAERARLRRAKEEGFSINKATKAMEFTVPKGRVIPESKSKKNMPMQANTADDIIKRALQEQAWGKAKRRNKALDKLPALIPINNVANTPKSNQFATLTMSSNEGNFASPHKPVPISDMAQISKTPSHSDNAKPPSIAIPQNASLPNVPQNIEQGSLVVLTVNDPNEPTKKMLQTYISHGAGKLTPVALPSTLLNSVMSYMKKGTSSSPQFTSPSGVGSAEESIGRSSVIQINPSPAKRYRHSSFTITHL